MKLTVQCIVSTGHGTIGVTEVVHKALCGCYIVGVNTWQLSSTMPVCDAMQDITSK